MYDTENIQITEVELKKVETFSKAKNTSVLVIFFDDMVKSTATKQQVTARFDETAFQKLRQEHDRLLTEIITRDGAGEVIKSTGDGLLAIFFAPSTAVERALEIQERLYEEYPDIRVRIGMDMGQVYVEKGIRKDVFGRRVDWAARAESLADGGHILVTRSVYPDAFGWIPKTRISWKEHGFHIVKDGEQPIEIFEPYNSNITTPMENLHGKKVLDEKSYQLKENPHKKAVLTEKDGQPKKIFHRKKLSKIIIGMPLTVLMIIVGISFYSYFFSDKERKLADGQIPTTKGNTVDNELRAYYPFSGNAYDESGNGNHGTVNGAILATDRFGNANAAYQFNGMTDYIQITYPKNLPIRSAPRTISAWIYPNGSEDQHRHIAGYGTDSIGQLFDIKIDITNKIGLVGWGREEGYDIIDITQQLYLNRWYHVASTYDGNVTVKLYVNGSLVKTSRIPSPYNTVLTLGGLTIGANNNQLQSWPFKGIIDEVRIYNRVLSEAEIQSLYELK